MFEKELVQNYIRFLANLVYFIVVLYSQYPVTHRLACGRDRSNFVRSEVFVFSVFLKLDESLQIIELNVS